MSSPKWPSAITFVAPSALAALIAVWTCAYNSAPSYTAESVVSVDINFKDENSINNYYDQKREASINEIEKERAAALDQCKKYQEMANWVNDIGSSFNFFKGRSRY